MTFLAAHLRPLHLSHLPHLPLLLAKRPVPRQQPHLSTPRAGALPVPSRPQSLTNP